MRVLIITPMPPNAHGSGAIPVLLHAQLEAMRDLFDITLVTVAGPDPNEWAAVERLRDSGLNVHAVRRATPTGVARWRRRWRFASTWLRGQQPWRTVWFHEPEVQEILDRITSDTEFDLIHVEDNAAASYRFPTGIPRLLVEHEVRRTRSIDWRGWKETRFSRWVLSEADWRRWQTYQPAVWRLFDRVIAFTQRDRELIREATPELDGKVVVNPFPTATGAQLTGFSEEQNAVLFVGNYSHPPNVDAALWLGHEIMPLLRSRCPGVRLMLVGPHPPESVQALATDDIEVTGFVPEIEPWFARAAVVVAPVRIGGGMRMKVLQAMSLGKPVVTTARGAEGLAVNGQHPPLLLADDTDEFVNATVGLLGSEARRRAIGNEARAFVADHHSPSAYVRRLKLIYEEMLSQR